MKSNYIYHKEGANLSVIKIDATHCFCCGINMANTTPDDTKTRHHAIPRELKPIRNIVLPVCRKCHGKIHTSQSNYENSDRQRVKKEVMPLINHIKELNKTVEKVEKTFKEK